MNKPQCMQRFYALMIVAILASCSGGGGSSDSSTSSGSGTGGSANSGTGSTTGTSPGDSTPGSTGSPTNGVTGSSGTGSGSGSGSGAGTGSTTGSGSGTGAGSGASSVSGTGGSTGSPATVSMNVMTYHNDLSRTGQQLAETTLTPANVNAQTFGKIGFDTVDGKVDAEPLYLAQVSIAGGTHNVLYVATENASVFAFDADSGTVLWMVSTLGKNETPSDDHGCYEISPEMGISSTPVIDLTRGPHGVIYVVGMSKDATGGYHQRIHALDVTTGAELFGGPTEITASYPGHGQNSTGGLIVFDPAQYKERLALLELNGVLYTGWASICDVEPYNAWIIAYSADTLLQTSVLNLTPNGVEGGIWESGGGMASDGQSIYVIDGNGTFDTTLTANGFPSLSDYGNGIIKLGTTNGLTVTDYFNPSNTVAESQADQDLGSGGVVLLPDLTDTSGTVHHLAIGAGKDSNIYVVDRDSMGRFNPSTDNIYQQINGQLAGEQYGTPGYFSNTLYFGAIDDKIKAFSLSNARVSSAPTSQSPETYGLPGPTPSISANGSANGIVWAVQNGDIAVLHAYDATNLANELYNSNQAPNTRDQFDEGNKFVPPMIANGKVYVGTPTGVAVFGLLGSP